MKTCELSDAEKYIMDKFWQYGTMSGIEVAKKVADKKWQRTTLYTFLSRLTAKEMIRAKKTDKVNVYVPLITKEDYQSMLGRRFLDEQYGGRAKDFLAAMVSGNHLSDDDIKELHDWLISQGGETK